VQTAINASKREFLKFYTKSVIEEVEERDRVHKAERN